MTLQVYPATPKPSYSYMTEHQLQTSVIEFESGTEQRNRRWRFPKRTFILNYKLLEFSNAKRDTITDFYYRRYGSYEAFWFFDFQSRKWIDQYLGRGDGVTQTFDVPGSSAGTFQTVTAILTEDSKKLMAEDGKILIEDATYDVVPIVYVDGVDVTTITESPFTFSEGTGEGDSDQIIFDLYTPAIGTLLTIDFTGYLRIKGRFKDDKLTEEIITRHLDNLAVSIYEVKY